MRNPFKRTTTYDPTELLDSTLYNEASFYMAFSDDLKHARRDVVIESPFLAVKRTRNLLPLFGKLIDSGVKIRINTRNPNHHPDELRIQAWQAISMLRDFGIKVRFYDDMRHRKIAIIDDCILWEGSLNIMSQSDSREVMRRIQSPTLAKQMADFCGLKSWK